MYSSSFLVIISDSRKSEHLDYCKYILFGWVDKVQNCRLIALLKILWLSAVQKLGLLVIKPATMSSTASFVSSAKSFCSSLLCKVFTVCHLSCPERELRGVLKSEITNLQWMIFLYHDIPHCPFPYVRDSFIQKSIWLFPFMSKFSLCPVCWKPILTQCQRLSCRGGKPKMRAEYIKGTSPEEICVQNIALISPQDANRIVGNQTKYMREQKTPSNTFSSQFHICWV